MTLCRAVGVRRCPRSVHAVDSVGMELVEQADGVVAAVAAFAVSGGLVVYDSWFLRKTRTLR